MSALITIQPMRFAIAIPQFFADGEFDPGAFRGYFARVEELGYHSAWAQESVLGTGPQLAPVEAMTYAAACTERLRLGCVVFVSTLYSPVHLAKSLSTLDQLSQGRTEIGVGTGGPARPFAAFGVDPHRYVARFSEGVELMKALWTEPRVTFDGEFWQLHGAAMEPKPAQKPHPPIWIGANGPAALRRAVRLGDGFFGAGSTPTATFAEQVTIVREALAAAGRPRSSAWPSGCTSRWTTTRSGPGPGWTPRWNGSTAGGPSRSRRPPSPGTRISARPGYARWPTRARN